MGTKQQNSIVNIDISSVSKSVNKLIDTVRAATGVAYEPTRIRRKAKAEADAQLILAKAEGESQEIAQRAAHRISNRELRRQRNVERIVEIAYERLPNEVSEKPVDEDWVHEFFGSCEDVSNEQMQELWGRILAGEVASPGRFSKRTLALVQSLSVKEASLLATLAKYRWILDSDNPAIIIQRTSDNRGVDVDLSGYDLVILESLGVLGLASHGAVFKVEGDQEGHLDYFGSKYHLEMDYRDTFNFGIATLTPVGKEIISIPDADPDRDYEHRIVRSWRNNRGIRVRPIG